MALPHDNDHFGPPVDGSASVLRASLVYSLVPYLGVLFVPITMGALVWSLLGRRGSTARRSDHVLALFGGIGILAFQLFLWWLLYYIPEIGI